MIEVPFFTLSGIKTMARLVDVYDGDTMTFIFPILGENYYKFNVRLRGIDTPEMRSDEGRCDALRARHEVLSICCDGYNLGVNCKRSDIREYLERNEINVLVECFEFDKYGRVLVDIYKGGESLCELLLRGKLGYEYDGGKKK